MNHISQGTFLNRNIIKKPYKLVKNLGWLVHNQRGAEKVLIYAIRTPKEIKTRLVVTYANSSFYIADFADPSVCIEWVKSRRYLKHVFREIAL